MAIDHFTHPNHELHRTKYHAEYLCNGCKTLGNGNGYRCHGCNFDMHEYCASCPMTLSSFMHPQHKLNREVLNPQAAHQPIICKVCDDRVEGLVYRCRPCGFDVHPLCTELPQQLNHELDAQHPLTLQPSSSSWCKVCGNACRTWHYSCRICCVSVHPECTLTPCYGSRSTSRSMPPPSFGVYTGYGYGYPPSFGPYHGYGYGYPPSFGPYHGYGFSDPYNIYPQHHHYGANHNVVGGGSFRKKIYEIVERLVVGGLTNMVFGASDFSFFS